MNDVKLEIMNTAYLEDNTILLYTRDAEGRRRIVSVKGFTPYFYAPGNEDVDIYGRGIRRVNARHPWEVPKLRQQYEYTCEADIPFPWRMLIDAGVKHCIDVEEETVHWRQLRPCDADPLEIRPRILYIDIEVASPPEIFPRPEDPKYPIVTIQAYDSYTDFAHVFILGSEHHVDYAKWIARQVLIHWYPDERRLLEAFIDFVYFLDPDIITGWHILGFDLPYLMHRSRIIGVDSSRLSPVGRVTDNHITGRAVIDLLEAYQRWKKTEGELPTYDLKFILKLETGYEYEDLGDRILEYWSDPLKHAELVTYCIHDVEALRLIDSETGLLEFYNQLRRIAGAPLDAIRNAQLIDYLTLRLRQRPLPTKTQVEEKGDVTGAIVLLPRPGLHEWVGVFDMKSLYPSLIVAYGISPEPEKSLMPRVVRYLMELREQYRSRRRMMEKQGRINTREYHLVKTYEVAAKFLACSTYGVFAYKGFRLFNPDVANEITGRGRETLRKISDYVHELGYEVIYGDTDSIFVRLNAQSLEEAIATGRFIEEKINEYLGGLECKFEKIYRRVFFKRSEKGAVKKRYAGWLIWKEGANMDLVEIKGFEPRRSDTADYTREAMKKFFEILLRQGREKALEYYHRARREFEKQPLWRIAIPKGVKMYTKTYKTDNPWLRGVRFAQRVFGWRFREDQKPLLLYIRHPESNVVCLPNPDYAFPWPHLVDVSKQREKAFDKKFQDIIKTLTTVSLLRWI